jgi:hypothetical protein
MRRSLDLPVLLSGVAGSSLVVEDAQAHRHLFELVVFGDISLELAKARDQSLFDPF